jgi:hypothetical protein
MSNLNDTFEAHRKSDFRTGWAQGGHLQTGNVGKDVSCQAKFGRAVNFTAQIDVDSVGDKIVAFTQAIVQWTVAGNTIVRTIDVAAGVSISGLAESVHVRVRDITPSSFPQNKEYDATILIAAEPRATTAVPPIFTGLLSTAVAANASVTVPVPNGANGVTVYGVVWPGAPSFDLQEQTADGSTVLLDTIVTPGQFVPLLAGAGLIVVTNKAASLGSSISVVFTIDG